MSIESSSGWIFRSWIGILLLAANVKSSIEVKEKCLPQESLSANSCSASNPGVSNTDKNKPPCYCIMAACRNYAIQNILPTCKSGFMHANKCEACVRCAKDLDEDCGGHSDSVGTCKQGLVCEISDSDESIK